MSQPRLQSIFQKAVGNGSKGFNIIGKYAAKRGGSCFCHAAQTFQCRTQCGSFQLDTCLHIRLLLHQFYICLYARSPFKCNCHSGTAGLRTKKLICHNAGFFLAQLFFDDIELFYFAYHRIQAFELALFIKKLKRYARFFHIHFGFFFHALFGLLYGFRSLRQLGEHHGKIRTKLAAFQTNLRPCTFNRQQFFIVFQAC